MKKIVTLILMLCIVLSLASCGKVEITSQEIFDAGEREAMLKNHQSVYVQESMDGEVFDERYLTKDYAYVRYPGEKFDYAQYMTDDASYVYNQGDYLCYLYVTSSGVTNDFASDYADICATGFTMNITSETIESVSEKDGRITVNSFLGEEALAELASEGLSAGRSEYVLDAKTRELISVVSDYTYDDGAVFRVEVEVTFDAEAPELLKTLIEYANQTENLRNVTVVNNPGTEKEVSQSFGIPKGLIVGFSFGDDYADKVEFYTDAACTAAFDPYADTESDLTVYVKWAE
jgi:hypothetical protein